MQVTTRKLTHSALMLALAMVLSLFKVIPMPNGGAVTIASMAPIILISLMYGTRWGLFTAFAYALLQMVEQFSPPPVQNFGSFAGVVLLDYLVAFTALGLARLIADRFSNKLVGAGCAVVGVSVLRFLCSFLSGILIWGSYAPEGTPVWIYSATYNGTYMLGECLMSLFAVLAVVKFVDLQRLVDRPALQK